MSAQATVFDVLVAAGLIGIAEGPRDLSSSYKAMLTSSLRTKTRRTGGKPPTYKRKMR